MRCSTGRPAVRRSPEPRVPRAVKEAPAGAAPTQERTATVRWSVDVRAIERARVLRAWTRGELARAAHVDEKTLRDMLSGRRRPAFGTVQAVCTALGLTLPDVIVFADVEG